MKIVDTYDEGDDLKNDVNTRISVRGGFSVDLEMGGSLHISPGLLFDYAFTPVFDGGSWRSHSIMFRIDATYAL